MSEKRTVGYFNGWVTEEEIKTRYMGYTDLLFGFWVDPNVGVAGSAAAAVANDNQIVKLVKSLNVKCILSAGGSTFTPNTSDPDSAATFGKSLAEYAKAHQFDGVDLDIENIQMNAAGIAWLVKATMAVKDTASDLIISHAPQAPYFTANGGYAEVEKQTKGAVDYYNIQYYNQGDWSYQSYKNYDMIFPKDYNGAPNPTSIESITASGVPAIKLLVGKPIVAEDATNTGYIPVEELCAILHKAIEKGIPFGGVMGWCVDSDTDGKWGEAIHETLNAEKTIPA